MNSNRPAMRRNRRVPGITGLVLLTFLASAAAQASEKDELASVQRQLDQVQASLERPAWRLHRPTRLTVAAFSLITVRPHPISTPSAAALTAIWSPPARNRVTRLMWPVITGGSGPDAHDIRTNERV